MGPKKLTSDELRAIRARAEAATPGPWAWSRSYDGEEIAPGQWEKLWCLKNPEHDDAGVGDGVARTINHWLNLWTLNTHDFDGVPLDETPDFAFIAHARADIPALLAHICAQDAELARLRDALAALVGPGAVGYHDWFPDDMGRDGCTYCVYEWETGQPERHAPDCPVAAARALLEGGA